MVGATGPEASSIFQAQTGFLKSLLPPYSVSKLQTQVGVITYGRNAELTFSLNKYDSKSDLRTALEKLRNPGDGTNIGEALQLARTVLFSEENGARRGVQKTLVIFLNAKIDENNQDFKTELQALKNAGIRVVVIGIGSSVDKKQAKEIASANAVFFPPMLEEMDPYLYPVYIATLKGLCIVC